MIDTLQDFTKEILRFIEKKPGADLSITLCVIGSSTKYDSEHSISVKLEGRFWDGSMWQTVNAADLNVLMDEIYRRCDFSDRETLHNNTLIARLLPAPESSSGTESSSDDEILF